MFLLNGLVSLVHWFTSATWRSFFGIFLLTSAVSIHRFGRIPIEYLVPNPEWELGAIAISLAQNGRFADPYIIPTGPTAHLPPVYPYLISLVYRWFGVTPTAGYVIFSSILVTASLLYALLPWFSERFGLGRQAGFMGGVIGALSVVWPGHGEYLTALVLALLLVFFLDRWINHNAGWFTSLLLGSAIGAAFHLQPVLLLVMIGCISFDWWWNKKQKKGSFVGMLVLGTVLACIPWTWRNYRTFDALFFMRSNLGLEARMGNHAGAFPTMAEMDANHEALHPRSHAAEARRIIDIGEVEYMRTAGSEALAWIAANPGDFLRLTVRRVGNVWAGPLYRPASALGVSLTSMLAFFGFWRIYPRLSIPQRAVFIIPLVTYPLVYYFTAYMPRYRIPIDWLLFILAGAAVCSLVPCEKPRSGSEPTDTHHHSYSISSKSKNFNSAAATGSAR